MTRWAILTGEYPPDPGGVSDYTRVIARELVRRGDGVRVYAPLRQGPVDSDDGGVRVHRLPGVFGPLSLGKLDSMLARAPRLDRILVQYVPHAFGYKAMNVSFSAWLACRSRQRAPIWVMFHEVAFPFRLRPFKHALLGAVTRFMARLVAGRAERIFVSVPAWGTLLKQICPHSRPPEWLPVPCNVPTDADDEAIQTIRNRFEPRGGPLVGHFGTFGQAIADLLEPVAVDLLGQISEANLLLIGRDSDRFRKRLARTCPAVTKRIHATGEVPLEMVSAHLRACDLLVQPFPDGIGSRRTSAMAGIANGLPVVTNLGHLSESVWSNGGVALAPSPDPVAIARLAARLIADPEQRKRIGERGLALYCESFALEKTISRLRGRIA